MLVCVARHAVLLQQTWFVSCCRGRSEEDKQRFLMYLINQTGQMHTMQGRMNSMIHGTLRTVSDEKSRFQNSSVGYHLNKDKH